MYDDKVAVTRDLDDSFIYVYLHAIRVMLTPAEARQLHTMLTLVLSEQATSESLRTMEVAT
jgi:hypothetical protein